MCNRNLHMSQVRGDEVTKGSEATALLPGSHLALMKKLTCIKSGKIEYLFTKKVGQKCCDLELSFCDFPEYVGFELKRQFF